jgi:tRNA-splicing ligase RtcB
MTHRVIRAISGVMGRRVTSSDFINRNHNHAELRDGRWIHRKGATHAEAGMMGVIPGNMRDGCFIVRGLGNPDSLYSSSHGAGRVLSRRKAKEQITLEQFEESMKGIPAATVGQATVDESPFAYKDIFKVMELQEDLVDIVHYIKPIINVKG